MGKKHIALIGICFLIFLAGCQKGQSAEDGADSNLTGEPELTKTATPEAQPSPTPFVNDFEHASAGLLADYEALAVLDADGVRGNLYLPLAGENGAAIVWKSSNPEVISDEERQNENYDATPAGVVVRQENDTRVILHAYLTLGEATLRKEFEVTVLAKPKEKEYTDYLFAYFTGNGANQEVH